MKTSQRTATKLLLLITLLALLLNNCAIYKPMALQLDQPPKQAGEKSLCLFTLNTKNLVAPDYEPAANNLTIARVDNLTSTSKYRFDRPINKGEVGTSVNKYLVSVELEPGEYVLNQIRGGASGLLINGTFIWDPNLKINVPADGIYYLGHVDMTNREKREGEQRSGSVIPLIDQAVTGFSQGTFDVKVSDKNETGIKQFIRTYPWLRNKTIDTSIMKRNHSVQ